MSAPLVSLLQVQQHLRLPVTPADEDVQRKIDQATEMIRQYLERPSDTDWTATMDAWTETTVPGQIAAAICYQVGELYRFRGDDPASPDREPGYVAPMVRTLLARYRDPVLA